MKSEKKCRQLNAWVMQDYGNVPLNPEVVTWISQKSTNSWQGTEKAICIFGDVDCMITFNRVSSFLAWGVLVLHSDNAITPGSKIKQAHENSTALCIKWGRLWGAVVTSLNVTFKCPESVEWKTKALCFPYTSWRQSGSCMLEILSRMFQTWRYSSH